MLFLVLLGGTRPARASQLRDSGRQHAQHSDNGRAQSASHPLTITATSALRDGSSGYNATFGGNAGTPTYVGSPVGAYAITGTADGTYPVSWLLSQTLAFAAGNQLRPVAAPLVTATYAPSAGAGYCGGTSPVTVTVLPQHARQWQVVYRAAHGY